MSVLMTKLTCIETGAVGPKSLCSYRGCAYTDCAFKASLQQLLQMEHAGTPGADKKAVWIIARQHPGEAMAEWFMEGLLEELTDIHNPFATRALKHAVFYIVPNINPDGAVRGHLRTNATGANLNREWAEPSLAHSPEVGCFGAINGCLRLKYQ